MSINSYFCVKKETENEMIIERSRFISYVKPCRTEEEARAFIEGKRKAHPFATHNCYAYIVERGSVARFSDDGEPQGTAGQPILEVINKNNLNYTIIIVVRYFGGIKLGAGGLLRAYSKGASNVIKLCNLKELIKGFDITITFNYDNLKTIDYLLKEENVYEKKYHDKIKYSFKTNNITIIDKIKNNKDITINNINEIYIEKN